MIDFNNDKKAADTLVLKVNELKEEIGKIIIGQDEVVNGLITSILSNGHALLIGVPGLAKTLLIKTISEALDLSFNRVQFTPDLMPSDIIGSEIWMKPKNSSLIKVLFLQILFWQTRLIGHHLRLKLPYLRPCKKKM